MFYITFEYRDKYCYPRWNQQSCKVSSVDECKKIYGLGVDCEYKILEVKKIQYNIYKKQVWRITYEKNYPLYS